MASNKNQHYVPQCYLRKFSSDEKSLSISLFNIDRKVFVEVAPIKGQCSKSYFYGRDLTVEKALQPIEGEYSSVIQRISDPQYKLIDDDSIFLKRFWLLQYMRTEAASRRSVEMTEELGKVAGATPQEYKMELREAVQNSMEMFLSKIDIVDDLSVCLVRNVTDVPFITSDDPAALTNKWHLISRMCRGSSFGLGGAGCLIILPLTPQILCLGYDKDVYRVSKSNGWVSIKTSGDIELFNEHQFLNCRANVFSSNKNSERYLRETFSKIEGSKPESRHRINYAVLDSKTEEFKRYKVIDAAEAGDHEEAVMHCQSVHASPSGWSSVIGWRRRRFAYNNGSGVGYIRRSQVETMRNEGFRKILIH